MFDNICMNILEYVSYAFNNDIVHVVAIIL